MISKRVGIVEDIIYTNDEIDEIKVVLNNNIEKAYNYKRVTGSLNIGDTVLLNTTAVELSLGTGGYHFVIANLNNFESSFTDGGHIMKLRYTPLQIKVNAVEEQDSIYHDKINNFKSLNNTPVVVGELHSMLVPFIASLKKHSKDKKVAYIMTDGASLCINLSKSVDTLKEKNLLDSTITIGNAFGGDYECVNIYTALITAKEIIKADVIFISMGPGITGTGTKYGFTGIEQGAILDSIRKLGGIPIFIPRISFADKRCRHMGISHHSITVLNEIVNERVNIPIPNYNKEQLDFINNQLNSYNLFSRHNIHYIDNIETKKDLEYFNLKVRTMGRNYDEDSEFFDSSSASAYYIREAF